MKRVDLIPEGWGPPPRRWSAGLFLALIITLISAGTVLWTRALTVHSAARDEHAESARQSATTRRALLDAAETEESRVSQTLAFIQAVECTRSAVSLPATLALLSRLAPAGVILDEIDIERASPGVCEECTMDAPIARAPSVHLTLRGFSESDDEITGFIGRVSESPYLSSVQTRSDATGASTHRFALSMNVVGLGGSQEAEAAAR